MEEYKYLLDIAIILISTKFLSICSRHFKLPAVVGALIAGVILGPVCLNVITIDNNSVIESLAEIGVIVLMFQAGLETDLKELKKSGMASFVIALCGVLVPLILGTIVGVFFEKNILQDIFMGVILTATSVSITVETLQEMGKLKSRAGTAILGAAIIDDILGVILLAINLIMTTSFHGTVLSLLDCSFTYLFARYIYLYWQFLDMKKIDCKNTGNFDKITDTIVEEVKEKVEDVKEAVEDVFEE